MEYNEEMRAKLLATLKETVDSPDLTWQESFTMYGLLSLAGSPEETADIRAKLEASLASSERERWEAGWYTAAELTERSPSPRDVVALANPEPSPYGLSGEWPSLEAVSGNVSIDGSFPVLESVTGNCFVTDGTDAPVLKDEDNIIRPQQERQIDRPAVARQASIILCDGLKKAGVSTVLVDEHTAVEMVMAQDPGRRPLGPGEELRGLSEGSTIYMTELGLDANTPAHEYAHVWANTLREKDPGEWAKVREAMKATPEWEQIASSEAYAHLAGDEDRIAGEVLATRTGNMAERRMDEAVSKAAEQAAAGEETERTARRAVSIFARDAQNDATDAEMESSELSAQDQLSARIINDYSHANDIGLEKGRARGFSVRTPDGLYSPMAADLSGVNLTPDQQAMSLGIAQRMHEDWMLDRLEENSGLRMDDGELTRSHYSKESQREILEGLKERRPQHRLWKGHGVEGLVRANTVSALNGKDASFKPWEGLSEQEKKPMTEKAEKMMKMLAKDYDLSPRDMEDLKEIGETDISEEAVRDIARGLHDSWAAEKIAGGYVYGKERNDDPAKGPLTEPELVPYDKLPEAGRKAAEAEARKVVETVSEKYTIKPKNEKLFQAEGLGHELHQTPGQEKKAGKGAGKAIGTVLGQAGQAVEGLGRGDVMGAVGTVAGLAGGGAVVLAVKAVRNIKEKKDRKEALERSARDKTFLKIMPRTTWDGKKILYNADHPQMLGKTGIMVVAGMDSDGKVNLFNIENGRPIFDKWMDSIHVDPNDASRLTLKDASGYNVVNLTVKDNLEAIKKGDPAQKMLLENPVDRIWNQHYGRTRFEKDGLYGFFDEKGTDEKKRYKDAKNYELGSDGLPYAIVKNTKGEEFVIDKGGNKVDNPEKLGFTINVEKTQQQGLHGDGKVNSGKTQSMHR